MRIKRHERGDTLVEVMVSIAIISLVLTAAYVTARRSYLSMQDSQEHSNALKLLERQTEALKEFNVQPGGHSSLAAATNFCMDLSSGKPQLKKLTDTNPDGTHPCVMISDATPAPSGAEPSYKVTVNPVGSVHIGSGITFRLEASWDSVLTKDTAKVSVEYGVY